LDNLFFGRYNAGCGMFFRSSLGRRAFGRRLGSDLWVMGFVGVD
jgi:hypothetical protein